MMNMSYRVRPFHPSHPSHLFLLFHPSHKYLQQKHLLARQLQSREGEAYALSNMGNTYTCLSQYEEAIQCQKASIKIAHDIGDYWGYAAALCNLGDAYRLSRKFDEAVISLLNSMVNFDLLQSPQIETVMILLTQIAFEIGIEDYIELLENHLVTIEKMYGKEIILKLREHLFEE